ncbi:MAG: NAD(P)-binding domain-containing protein [Acidimicrobiia bacterium]|nr:NAD(P)-binding domain-containing protein [Acidimicrobiia bacterium]
MRPRSKYRAMEVRDSILERWPDQQLSIDAGDNHGRPAEAEIVVIATPWDAAASTASSVATQLDGKVVISMANALAKVGHEFQPLVPPRRIGRGQRAGRRARSRCVARALHHVPAKELGDIDVPVESDVLICSDDPSATNTVVDIVSKVPDLAAARRRRAVERGTASRPSPRCSCRSTCATRPARSWRHRATSARRSASPGPTDPPDGSDDAPLRHRPSSGRAVRARASWCRCTPAASRRTTRPTSVMRRPT